MTTTTTAIGSSQGTTTSSGRYSKDGMASNIKRTSKTGRERTTITNSSSTSSCGSSSCDESDDGESHSGRLRVGSSLEKPIPKMCTSLSCSDHTTTSNSTLSTTIHPIIPKGVTESMSISTGGSIQRGTTPTKRCSSTSEDTESTAGLEDCSDEMLLPPAVDSNHSSFTWVELYLHD